VIPPEVKNLVDGAFVDAERNGPVFEVHSYRPESSFGKAVVVVRRFSPEVPPLQRFGNWLLIAAASLSKSKIQLVFISHIGDKFEHEIGNKSIQLEITAAGVVRACPLTMHGGPHISKTYEIIGDKYGDKRIAGVTRRLGHGTGELPDVAWEPLLDQAMEAYFDILFNRLLESIDS
jgi:hypothetical protein